MTALTEVTRLLLADNIRHRLVTNGLSVEVLENDGLGTTAQRDDATMDKVRRSMRFLCTEVYRKHETELVDMLKKLHIVPNTVHLKLETIMISIFCDEINWGRIATLVAFCSMLAEQCLRMEMPYLVPKLIDWVTLFVDTQLYSWIAENNGWTGILVFYDPDSSFWSFLKNVCGHHAHVGLSFMSHYGNAI